MTRPLQEAAGPKRLLEVGAGTGAFTRRILAALAEGDELHIVELNPSFCRRLESNLVTPFRRDHPRIGIHLHCGPIQTVALDGRFDFIVCGLPFNNFPTTVVRSVFKRLLDLLAEGGHLAYFEYAGVRRLAVPLAGPRQRRRLRRLRAIGQILHRRHAGRRELVMVNVPPAYAVHLSAPKAETIRDHGSEVLVNVGEGFMPSRSVCSASAGRDKLRPDDAMP
jgi:phospholipid N-methyltransferase